MNINQISQIIEMMKQSSKKVWRLGNGWNIKEIGNHREYELFNDDENTFINCKNVNEIMQELEKIKQ